jgi:hypothetical protein
MCAKVVQSLAIAVIVLPCLCAAVLLSGCKPDKLEMEIYTSDIQKATSTGVVEVPLTATFSIMGDDDDNDLPKAAEVAKRYLDEKAEFKQSKGTMGDVMVVKCSIPMGTADALKAYLTTKHRPFALTAKGSAVEFAPTEHLKALNQDLSGISMMLNVELPSGSTVVRIVGDSAEAVEVHALAIFVDEKPELVYRKKLNRRDTVSLDYRGGEDSVYSEVPAQFTVTF